MLTAITQVSKYFNLSSFFNKFIVSDILSIVFSNKVLHLRDLNLYNNLFPSKRLLLPEANIINAVFL